MPVPVKGAGKGYIPGTDGFPSGAAVIKRTALFKIIGCKHDILGEYKGTIGILPYTTELFLGGYFKRVRFCAKAPIKVCRIFSLDCHTERSFLTSPMNR